MAGFAVAVVGATGVVGQEMLRVLEQRQFPVTRLVPIASARSEGKSVAFRGGSYPIVPLREESFDDVQVALFSAGATISRQWCPVAAGRGALVIDNSSAWRMDPEVPLCVPEVNLDTARVRPRGIVANPNCSTIQLMVALKPIHDAARIRRIVVATYQAISGAGATAVASFEAQLRAYASGESVPQGSLPGQLAGSLLMSWKPDPATGYSEEEIKIIRETRRILNDETIRVSPTTVRVPVLTAHSEAVTIEAERPLSATMVRDLLRNAPGIELVDDFANGRYPTPLDAAGQDPVYVGRIRDDLGNPGGVQLWVVSDNLRKGAALNAVQIAEGLLS